RRPASRSLVRCRRWYFSSGHCCNARRSPLPARSFRHKSSNDMAFPHPKSRKDKYGNEDETNKGSVVGNCFKRTINIPDYRNGKDEVNPAKNRTFGGATDHLPFPFSIPNCLAYSAFSRCQPPNFMASTPAMRPMEVPLRR